jgi:hypothetical protein
MISYDRMVVAQERYKDYLREAEVERLLRSAQDGKPGSRWARLPLWLDAQQRRALGWLGTRLTDWGMALQERSGVSCGAVRPEIVG